MEPEERIIASNIDLARRLGAWLRTVGVVDTSLAVDLADTVSAAKPAESVWMEMLVLDVTKPDDADQALEQMGKLHTWLFDEIKHHLTEIERAWPQFEERLVELAPDES